MLRSYVISLKFRNNGIKFYFPRQKCKGKSLVGPDTTICDREIVEGSKDRQNTTEFLA
jgi:hypothetical protein